MRSSEPRIAGLDVLRGCAAVAVMLHHHGQYYDALHPGQRTPLPIDLGPGHFGVELFFVISGFVIFMTVERKDSVRAFAMSRVARLMPTFLVVLAMAAAISLLSPSSPIAVPTLRQFLANMTMAPSLFGELEIDMPYWTLTYELIFYAAMGLLMAMRRLRAVEWIGLAAVLASCLLIMTTDLRLHRRIGIVLLAYYSNFFLIGICLYLIHRGRARALTWVALAVAVLTTALGGGERSFYASGGVYLAITAAFTVLVWFASAYGDLLAWRPLAFLGSISYPLYLVHVAVGFQVIRFGVEFGWNTWTSTAAAAVTSVAIATLLHYLVELPGQRWGRAVETRRAWRAAAGSGRDMPRPTQQA